MAAINYKKWEGMGEEEEDEETMGFLNDIQNKHQDYVNYRSSLRKEEGGAKKEPKAIATTTKPTEAKPRPQLPKIVVRREEPIFEDFAHSLRSISARGEFLAREARRSIEEMRQMRQSGTERLDSSRSEGADALRAAIAAQVDAELERALGHSPADSA